LPKDKVSYNPTAKTKAAIVCSDAISIVFY